MAVSLSQLNQPGLSTYQGPTQSAGLSNPIPQFTPNLAPTMSYNPNGTTFGLSQGSIQPAGGVLGAAATNNPTSGGGGGSNNNNGGNSGGQDAYLSSLQTRYDQNMSDLQGQLTSVGQQRDSALSGLQNQQNQLLSDVGNQKTDVNNQRDTAISQAADTARGTQMQNRNILRSLGILNSSYAADKLQQPNNLFDTARANIVQQAQQRVGQLDDFINNKKAEFVNTYGQLQNQFSNLMNNIQSDMRFTDRQRADAVNAANQAYQSRLDQLHQGTQSLVQQAEAARQNFITSHLQGAIGANPDLLTNLDQLNLYKQNLTNAGSVLYGSPQTASIYQDPNQKKNTLSGQ